MGTNEGTNIRMYTHNGALREFETSQEKSVD
jgi:hypothetical protein